MKETMTQIYGQSNPFQHDNDHFQEIQWLVNGQEELEENVALPLTRQSPIDIRNCDICLEAKFCCMKSLKFEHLAGECSHVVVIPGRGWNIIAKDHCRTAFIADQLPEDGNYRFLQAHAHWGRTGDYGSEHLLEGKGTAAELHFVFWNTLYKSPEEALSRDDGYAVVAIFLEESDADNEDFKVVVDAVQKSHREGGSDVALPSDFSIETFLPPSAKRDFCTYLGSLTTPPYSECVIWTVLKESIPISKKQLDVFREISPENTRECQNLRGRQVRSTFTL